MSTAPLKDRHEEESKLIKKSIAQSIEKVMIQPSHGNTDEVRQYLTILKRAWSEFDRVPYRQTTVLDVLQVNVFDKI